MKDYSPEVSQLFTLGIKEGNWLPENWPSYPELYHLTEAHIPELMDILESCNDIYEIIDGDYCGVPIEQAVWAPHHAWRALGQLRFEPVLELLIKIIRMDESFDYLREEIPSVIGLIGESAIPIATALIQERSTYSSIEIMGAEGLEHIAKLHPELRDRCVQELVNCLQHCEKYSDELNGMIILYLRNLGAKEALPVIEQAFAANKVDEMIMGDWIDVQYEFGAISMLELKQLQQALEKQQHKPVQLKFSTNSSALKDKDKGFGGAVDSLSKKKKKKKKSR